MKDGKADYLGLGETTPPDKDTSYLISSMTKPILAVAVGIQVSSGAFQLDAPVEEIVEKTDGRPWPEFMNDEIFAPLRMDRSTADMSYRKPEGNIAKSYCAQINGSLSDDVDGNDAAAVHEIYRYQQQLEVLECDLQAAVS